MKDAEHMLLLRRQVPAHVMATPRPSKSSEAVIQALHHHIVAKELVQHVAVEHVSWQQHRESSLPFRPAQTPWHRFLDELCILCDFKSGGKTVRSIAVQATSTGSAVFRAATTHTDAKAFQAHLTSILEELKKLLNAHRSRTSAIEATASIIHDLSVDRSSQKIKEYSTLASQSIQQAVHVLSGSTASIDQSLRGKLYDLNDLIVAERSHKALCRTAYDEFRHTTARARLDELVILGSDSLWEHLRHRIGRLGSFKKAARFLAKNASSFADIIGGAPVELVDAQPRNRAPIEVETDLVPLLERVCPWLDQPQVLSSAAGKLQTAERKLKNLRGRSLTPSVHAEVVIADHFYTNELRFMNDDRYIGCSKPSCYCCSLYLDTHPGHVVQRPCHGNVYVRWSPPRSPDGTLTATTINVLQSMIQDIQADLKVQIQHNIYGRKRSRDSTTGLSESVRWDDQTATVAGPA